MALGERFVAQDARASSLVWMMLAIGTAGEQALSAKLSNVLGGGLAKGKGSSWRGPSIIILFITFI